MSAALPQLVHLPEIKKALGFSDRRAVQRLCARHDITLIRLSSRAIAMRASDFETLLDRASGKLERV
jgi:hypothetical protein